MVFNEPWKLSKNERIALLRFILFLGVVPGLVSQAWAHEGHHSKIEQARPTMKKDEEDLKIRKVNAAYRAVVRPLFQRACFDCHSSETRYPWYAQLPFVHSMIERDVTEAKKHLDMSLDFPFKGHGSVEEDLAAIAETLRKGSMPPRAYRIMHSESRLSALEKQRIQAWVEESLKTLGQ